MKFSGAIVGILTALFSLQTASADIVEFSFSDIQSTSQSHSIVNTHPGDVVSSGSVVFADDLTFPRFPSHLGRLTSATVGITNSYSFNEGVTNATSFPFDLLRLDFVRTARIQSLDSNLLALQSQFTTTRSLGPLTLNPGDLGTSQNSTSRGGIESRYLFQRDLVDETEFLDAFVNSDFKVRSDLFNQLSSESNTSGSITGEFIPNSRTMNARVIYEFTAVPEPNSLSMFFVAIILWYSRVRMRRGERTPAC